MRGLVCSVTAFMRRAGMSNAQIRGVFEQCISGDRKKATRMPKKDEALSYGRDTVAGAVLRAWHTHPKYMSSSARPIPLRASGPEPTIESLILSQDKRADVSRVVRSMLDSGLMRARKDHKYVPKKESAMITTLDPLSVDHIAKTVMRLVETASRNTGKSRGKLQLIERYAHVPDLARRESKAFALFSRQQGQAYLDSIEDWLETRQTRNQRGSAKRGSGVNAGAHVFAFIADRP
jgi:hypothetical protein